MKNKSRYIQLFYLRENWHNRTIRWLRSYGQELNYISIPIDEPNTLMILGFGSFFTPIIRENYATCLCAVVSGNAFGFIGNRMLFAYEAEAVQMAEEGVSPSRIDDVIKNTFGFAMGPFAVADLSGLDVYHFISQSQHGAPLGRIPIIEKLVEQGRLGQKSGKGFFKYDKAVGKGRQPIPDPEVEQLIAQLAKDAGIAQNPNVTDERSSHGARARWPTAAPSWCAPGSRCGPATSTSSGSTATASRRTTAARCGTRRTKPTSNRRAVRRPSTPRPRS